MKILLVDDSPTVISVTSKMLEKMGHSVSTAENGEAGVAAYEALYQAKHLGRNRVVALR